jgi:hypothetical protein
LLVFWGQKHCINQSWQVSKSLLDHMRIVMRILQHGRHITKHLIRYAGTGLRAAH